MKEFVRLQEVRAAEFPEFGGAVYLNAASWGLMPRRAVEASAAFTERRSRGPTVLDQELVDAVARARLLSARMVAADPTEITLCPNTSFGVNLAAALTETRGPGVIVVSEGEFPANVFPWLALEARGFTVRRVPALPGGWPDEEGLLRAAAMPDVRALAVSAVQFASGYRADLRTLGARCRELEVLFAVDAIQELGSGPMDVTAAHIDVLSCGAQKWLCGPWGSGFAYVAKRHHDRFDPPMVSWLSFADAADFEDLLAYRYEFCDDATKFELATLGIQDYAAMSASMEIFLDIGLSTIREYLLQLTQPILDWVDGRSDVQLVSPPEADRRAGIVMLRPDRLAESASALRAAGVVSVVREGAIRLSPHLYNTPDHIGTALAALERANG